MRSKSFIMSAILISGLILFVGGISPVSAATSTINQATTSTQAITVATVNMYNARLDSQTGNIFNISFDISNRTGVQPQIKYAVMLVKQTTSTETVIDEKVYPDIISLGENDQRHITLTYQAPASLSGDYLIEIDTQNASGFPFGTVPVSDVTLQGTGSYLLIDSSSSFFTVTQDATTTDYPILRGVDVLPSENLIAHITVSNPTSNDVTAIPHITTYYRDQFGKVMGTENLSSVTFSKNSTTTFSFEVPKPTDPQVYSIVITLNDNNGAQISNIANVYYVIDGQTATIQNVVFNKSSYQKGDTATILFVWSGSFSGSRKGESTSTPQMNLTMQIKDANGSTCSDSYKTSLSNAGVQTIVIPVTKNCITPEAIVSISDQQGNILANNSFTTASTTTETAKTSVLWIIFWIIIVIALLIVIIYYIKQNKKLSIFSKGKGTIIAILLIIVGSFAFYGHQAKADTVNIWNTGYYFTASLHGSNGNLNNVGYPVNSRLILDLTVQHVNIPPYDSIISATVNINNSTTSIPNNNTENGLSAEIFGAAPYKPGQYYVTIVIYSGPNNMPYTYMIDYSVGDSSGGPSCSISASPFTIYIGKTTTSTISWNCSGANQTPNACSLTNDANPSLRKSVNSSGSYIDIVPTSKNKVIYNINCPNYSYSMHGSANTTVTVDNGYNLQPTDSITAKPSTIYSGENSTLSWTSANVDSCFLSGGIFGGTKVPLNSSTTVYPTVNQTYTIQCNGFYGSAINSTLVNVINNNSNNSLSCNLSANPTSIYNGQNSTLSWTSKDAQSCSIDNGIGNVGLSGTTPVNPSATTKYTLTCSNPGGDKDSSVTVTVSSNPNTSQTPSCTISSDRSQLIPPQSANISWNCLYVKDGTCSINGTPVSINSNGGPLTVSPTSTTNYTISCAGNDGSTPSNSTKITVSTTSIKEIAP